MTPDTPRSRDTRDPDELQRYCERLEEQVKTLNARLASLLEISGLLASTKEPQPVFDVVLNRALELTGAGEGALMLTEEDSLLAAWRGLKPRIAAESRPRLGEGVEGWVAEHGEPLLGPT